MSTGAKLTAAACCVAAAIGYLAYLGAASSWQYYVSVDEVAADLPQLMTRRIRVSGRVEPGSLAIASDRRHASFRLAGEHSGLPAMCNCLLPDNLAENIDVVVEGTLQPAGLVGTKVITRCASKYEQTKIAAEPHEPQR